MPLPKYIETEQDYENMRIFLKAQDKESLVDFIMKNATNESFYKRLKIYFEEDIAEIQTSDGLFDLFREEVMPEFENDRPDTDFVVSASERFIAAADKLPSAEKEKFLVKLAACGYADLT